MKSQANTESLVEELTSGITIHSRGATRAATPQEARAIKFLAEALDDQPPPAAKVFSNLDEDIPARVARIAAQQATSTVIPVVRGSDSAFVSPEFERMTMAEVMGVEILGEAIPPTALEYETALATTRDDVQAFAREIAARQAKGEATEAELPFGAATMRLFCA
ncbi:MAG: hypothetical protein AB7G06_08505 [Bdellovibrionales bacterium]